MSEWELTALRAKIRVANNYLNQAFKSRGKVDLYDIHKVISRETRKLVDICDLNFINQYGKTLKTDIEFIKIREAV